MADYGLTGFGAYVPRLRLERSAIAAAHRWMAPSLKGLAKGERAFASWDEDPITMAVEAARDCLGVSDRRGISSLTVASTTFPYASLQNSIIAAGALSLKRTARAQDIGGSHRVGVAGLAAALGQREGDQLFAAADRLRAKPASSVEMSYGAGAAAFRLGSDKVVARLLGTGSVVAQFVDHFRPSDAEHDYFWEERWIRDEGYIKLVPEAIAEALCEANLGISDVRTLIMASPLKGMVAAVAKVLNFKGDVADSLDAEVGYTGTAHPLLQLVKVLETAKTGERILVIGFGQGAEVIILEVTDHISSFRPVRGVSGAIADKVVTNDYLRMLSFYDAIELEWGMRAERESKAALTTQYRTADQLTAFVAGKCSLCDTIQFPQLAYCVNPECNAPSSKFASFPLPDQSAKVLTFTADSLSYYPAPPMFVGFAQFDVGARLLMEMVDVGPEGLEVGTKLRIVFRIKEVDKARGFRRYFWKAVPVPKGV